MEISIIDFETYSPISIKAGALKYASHPDADIVYMGYKLEDHETRLWTPGMPWPEWALADLIMSHGTFDYYIWHLIAMRKYGATYRGVDGWRDSMALCARYTLPLDLNGACNAMDTEIKKNPRGKELIKKISVPTKDGRRPQLGIDYTSEDYIEYGKYCADDVNSTYHLVKALPSSKLSDYEQEIYALTKKMNLRGLPIDLVGVNAVNKYINLELEAQQELLPEYTDGVVTKITQVQRIVKWVISKGYDLPNLQAMTIDDFLIEYEEKYLDDSVRMVLEIRQALGGTAVRKFNKMLEMEVDGRVHNNLQYHGAAPGRWSARGVQMHNFPRAKTDDPDGLMQRFIDKDFIEDPVKQAKTLVRPAICAPDGRTLIVSDYVSIENVLLVWFADDQDALNSIRAGKKQYIEMASFIFNQAYEEIEKGSEEYNLGKMVILGAGYCMSPPKFVISAKQQWNVVVSKEMSELGIGSYREKYELVKDMWYDLKDLVVAAINNPGKQYSGYKCIFKCRKDRNGYVWFTITLPSGRMLFYAKPTVEMRSFEYLDSEGKTRKSRAWTPMHWGRHPQSGKWVKRALIPGRITENIVQAAARDIMAAGMLEAEKTLDFIDIIGTVHDECIGEMYECATEQDREMCQDMFDTTLCTLPEWAQDIPLRADGYISRRYKKD